MLKAIIEVYSELLVTNFYAQISCSRHSKFIKIIFTLMHRGVSAVVAYIRFPALTKLIWLVICPTNSEQKNGPAQFRTTTANRKLQFLSIKPTKNLLQPNVWKK